MSEEDKIVAPQKQYALLVGEVEMLLLSRLVPGMQFLEIEGMDIQDNPGYQVLATNKAQETPPDVA